MGRPATRSGSSTRRNRESVVCSEASGDVGGCSPHKRATSRSTETTRPWSSARWATSARGCGPPSSSGLPSASTSIGPSSRIVHAPDSHAADSVPTAWRARSRVPVVSSCPVSCPGSSLSGHHRQLDLVEHFLIGLGWHGRVRRPAGGLERGGDVRPRDRRRVAAGDHLRAELLDAVDGLLELGVVDQLQPGADLTIEDRHPLVPVAGVDARSTLRTTVSIGVANESDAQ